MCLGKIGDVFILFFENVHKFVPQVEMSVPNRIRIFGLLQILDS